MATDGTGVRRGWAYENLVTSIPGLDVNPGLALAAQFVGFETVALALAAWYDLWFAVPLATVAIAIATAGSSLMVTLSDRLQRLTPPAAYRAALFESGLDVFMGLVAFVALVSYLLVAEAATGGPLVDAFRSDRPVLAIAFGLFVAWDLCYRVGTAWWASLTGLWRTVSFRSGLDDRTRRAYARLDLLTLEFAGLHLLLLPFLWADRVLVAAVVGHVVAVVLVSSLSAVLLARW